MKEPGNVTLGGTTFRLTESAKVLNVMKRRESYDSFLKEEGSYPREFPEVFGDITE